MSTNNERVVAVADDAREQRLAVAEAIYEATPGVTPRQAINLSVLVGAISGITLLIGSVTL